MRYMEYNEKKQHGIKDFPIQLYVVGKDHSEYVMPLHWHKELEIIEPVQEREENIELRELCLLNFDRSSAYIALLFLMREEEYELYQEEFYGKLFVKKAQKTEIAEEEN